MTYKTYLFGEIYVLDRSENTEESISKYWPNIKRDFPASLENQRKKYLKERMRYGRR